MQDTGSRAASSRTLAAFADTAAFSLVLAAPIAIPITFSIDDLDVFARPKTILAVSLAAALAVLLALRRIGAGETSIRRGRHAVTVAALLFVAWNIVAAWFAIGPWHAVTGEPLQHQGLAAFLAYVVFLFAARATVRTEQRRTILLCSIAIGAAVVAAYAILQALRLDPIWAELPRGRVFSSIGQANSLAAYLVLVLPMVIVLGRGRRPAIQLLIAGLAMAVVVAIGLTLSRGAFLGVAVAAMVFGATSWRRRGTLLSRRALVIGAASVFVLLMAVLVVPQVRTAATAALDRVVQPGRVEQASSSAHLDQWAVGLAIALDRPLLGAGQDSYVLLFHEYRDDVLPPDRARVWARYRPESPHNVYLAIAGGAGVVALAAYLAVVLLVARHVIEVLGAGARGTALFAATVLAALAANLVTDFFMTAETTESVLFWILLGVAAGLRPRSERPVPGPRQREQPSGPATAGMSA